MTPDEKLAHSLRIKFGTSDVEPDAQQLAQVKSAISQITRSGGTPTENDWRDATARYCPTAGTWKYAGLDNSDLNVLLAMATQAARGQ